MSLVGIKLETLVSDPDAHFNYYFIFIIEVYAS